MEIKLKIHQNLSIPSWLNSKEKKISLKKTAVRQSAAKVDS